MNKNQIRKYKFLPFEVFFFFAPFAVSSSYENITTFLPTSVLLLSIIFVYSIYVSLKIGKINISRIEKTVIVLFILPVLLSLCSAVITLISTDSEIYKEYFYGDLPRRVLMAIFNVTTFLTLLSITNNWEWERIAKFTKKYYLGLLVFLVIGIWQFLHFTFDVPFFNIDTRSHIHGVDNTNLIFNWRLTSLANEPSYLAPLMIELFLLVPIFSTKTWLIRAGSLFVLIFSYSGGGYLNLLILIIAYLVTFIKYDYNILKNKDKRIYIGISIILSILMIFNHEVIYNTLYPVIGRLTSLFDISKHGRMFMSVMPFLWVLSGTLLNAFFGFGPSAYKILSKTKLLPSGVNVHITSNNLFADTVYELGYFGVFSYLGLFFKLIIYSYNRILSSKKFMLSYLLCIHLLSSSLYRADFMQPRFWVMLFIILKLIQAGDRESKHTSTSITNIFNYEID